MQGEKSGKIDESELPWFSQELTAKATENPSITENRRLLSLYARNISRVKQHVQLAATAPPGIPASEIENALRGQAINLDAIFTALHHTRPPKENVGRVGSTEIRFEASQPSRRVSTSGEWAAAWNRARQLLVFLFPHRATETMQYGDYINQQFAAKLTSAHHRVILYDKGVRNFIQGGQRHLLTDVGAFQDIFVATIMADGIEYGAGGTSSKKTEGGGNSTAICRCFNLNRCPNEAKACPFRHICSDRKSNV